VNIVEIINDNGNKEYLLAGLEQRRESIYENVLNVQQNNVNNYFYVLYEGETSDKKRTVQ